MAAATTDRIKLTQGKEALVLKDDFEYLNQFKWSYDSHNHCAVRGIWNPVTKTTRVVSMHRFLMDTPENMVTDHKNGDRLDNRRDNLRVCTYANNSQNMKTHKDNTSGYKGVSRARNGNWVAKIKNKTIGTFKSKVDAAKAYNLAANEQFGEFAKFNEVGEI